MFDGNHQHYLELEGLLEDTGYMPTAMSKPATAEYHQAERFIQKLAQ